jgi:hypothetical protein
LVAILGALIISPWLLLILLIYPVQFLRLGLRATPRTRDSWDRAFFMTIAKFPEARGVWDYVWGRLRGKPSALIEYK